MILILPLEQNPILGNILFWILLSFGTAVNLSALGVEWQIRYQNICNPKQVNFFLFLATLIVFINYIIHL
jgi:hypothetical protein